MMETLYTPIKIVFVIFGASCTVLLGMLSQEKVEVKSEPRCKCRPGWTGPGCNEETTCRGTLLKTTLKSTVIIDLLRLLVL